MEPLILCITPTRDRDTLQRAVDSFYSQTWRNKYLIVLNTGKSRESSYVSSSGLTHIHLPLECGRTVGALRNIALSFEHPWKPVGVDYIAHFDDDDVSAPDRLERQLAHIQKTGKLLTGFYDMPMHDEKAGKTWTYVNEDHRYALGTSLFYRRQAWERVKFPEKTPEDNQWRKEVGLDNCESQSCFREDGSPMMVQTVHGANASARITPSSHRFQPAKDELSAQVRELLK